jgi:hypothetical protein
MFTPLTGSHCKLRPNTEGKYRAAIKRQCRIVDPDISDATVDHLLETNTTADIFKGKRLDEAESALNEIKDRHEDILRLERSLQELHSMFLDMAILYGALNFEHGLIRLFLLEEWYKYISSDPTTPLVGLWSKHTALVCIEIAEIAGLSNRSHSVCKPFSVLQRNLHCQPVRKRERERNAIGHMHARFKRASSEQAWEPMMAPYAPI